jgi:hypothetical protein
LLKNLAHFARQLRLYFAINIPRGENHLVFWLRQSQRIIDDPTLSVDTRLWARFPKISLERFGDDEKALSPSTKTAIINAVAKADQNTKSYY